MFSFQARDSQPHNDTLLLHHNLYSQFETWIYKYGKDNLSYGTLNVHDMGQQYYLHIGLKGGKCYCNFSSVKFP